MGSETLTEYYLTQIYYKGLPMWDMIDDVTSTIGSSARLAKEYADRALMKESAETSAVEHLLKQPHVQVQILERVEEDLLKSFGVRTTRDNIIDFSTAKTAEQKEVEDV